MSEIAVADLRTAEDFRRHAKALRERRERLAAVRTAPEPLNAWSLDYYNQFGRRRCAAELIYQVVSVVRLNGLEIESRPSIRQIQRECASRYDVGFDDLISHRRDLPIVQARQVAMLLSKLLRNDSMPEIGRRFGGRDHTTVLHACRKLAWLGTELETLLRRSDPLERWVSKCVELYPLSVCRAQRKDAVGRFSSVRGANGTFVA